MFPTGNRRRQGDNRLQPLQNRNDPSTSSNIQYFGPTMPNTAPQRCHYGRKERADKKEIPAASAKAQDINLHQAENAWVPSCKMKENYEGSSGDTERDTLRRNVQSVLNKLTFQKFKILLAHLKRLNICTEKEMAVVVDLIYENAVHEPHFSAIYANLCKHLEMIKIPIAEKSEEKIDFATLLLTKCQEQFEEHCNAQDIKIDIVEEDGVKVLPENPKDLQSPVLESDFTTEEKCEGSALSSEGCNKNKARRLGNIKFIGELFKLNMILKPVLHECIIILLMKQSEESLECLCLLIKTVGKELESYGNDSEKKEVDEYFLQIQNIVDGCLTSTRIRFLLKDILDLKNNNWIPRRVENVPRTIDEIHKEAALEARKQWQWYQNMMYIAAQSDNQTQTEAHTYNNACLCKREKSATFKNKRKDSHASNQTEPNTDTLDEARRILIAQGRKGQQNSVKNKVKKKPQGKPKNKKESESSGSNPKL